MDEKPPYSGFAITGFILGIISVFAITGFILGIIDLGIISAFAIPIIPVLGIIFSSIGIFKTRKKKKKGKVLAIIGLVLSIIIFIYSISFLPWMLFEKSG